MGLSDIIAGKGNGEGSIGKITLNILVTGAAGYIGSVLTEEVLREGHRVIALDNLQQGHRHAITPGAEFVLVDLGNSTELDSIFKANKIDAVMHLAAESIVSQSMSDPGKFFRNNLIYGVNLLDTMLKHGVYKLVYSSSAAVYGEPREIPIIENHPKLPLNPYGESKLMFESILSWYERAYGLKSVGLRYFNVAGASHRLGEDHNPETHLIPNILKVALGRGNRIIVYGKYYPTPDGTCIRDYIHICDVARAHILALQYLDNNSTGNVYNLGNEKGYSVLEVVEAVQRVTGIKIPVEISPPRKGDPAVLVASSERAKAELGWRPAQSDMESIVSSAWEWQKQHPDGYAGKRD